MSDSKKVIKKHFAQLDSLRAFAVAGVAWSHWMPNYTFGLPCSAGVQLFFVLSGFLITCILLQARSSKDLNKGNSTTASILKAFYSRRFLRIFPLYYLVLLIVVILNLPGARESFLWHFGYASNYYYFLLNTWNGPTSHFWTLAVEEQFYLFWPIVVLLVSRRYLIHTFVGFVVFGIVYRLIGDLWFSDWLMWDITSFGSFDSLCLGGILAYFHQTQSQAFSNKDVSEEESLRLKLQFCLILSLSSYVIMAYVCDGFVISGTIAKFCLNVFFAVIIYYCVLGVRGPIGAILNSKILIYLGTISYGLYVYHNFAGLMSAQLLRLLGIPHQTITVLALNFALTIIVASLSWRLIERPINNYKRLFPYLKAEK